MSIHVPLARAFLAFILGASTGALADPPDLASAHAAGISLAPLHAGEILDQDPFDGRGDAIDERVGMAVGLNSQILDMRGVIEFDLSSLKGNRRIESATLQITPLGRALPGGGAPTVPIQLYAYPGEPTLQLEDFNQEIFVDVFEGLGPTSVPINVDVTEAVQLARLLHVQILGFSMRTNVHGAFLNYGSRAVGSEPKLFVTFR